MKSGAASNREVDRGVVVKRVVIGLGNIVITGRGAPPGQKKATNPALKTNFWPRKKLRRCW